MSQVYDRWETIIGRLRAAKAAIPASTELALNEKMPASSAPVELVRQAGPKTIAVKPTLANAGSKMRMNSISIRSVDTAARDDGVLVIRPKVTVVDDSGAVAVNDVEAPVRVNDAARVIHVAAAQPASAAPAGPRFIFEN